MKTPQEAYDILNSFEFGDMETVKRSPLEKDYEAALATLREFFEGHPEAPESTQLTLEHYKHNSVNSNHCHEQAIRALRYVAKHGRTAMGGCEFPNDECCLMIADELERAWRNIHAALSNEPLCPECKDTGLRDHGGTYPWGEHIEVPCDCGLQP